MFYSLQTSHYFKGPKSILGKYLDSTIPFHGWGNSKKEQSHAPGSTFISLKKLTQKQVFNLQVPRSLHRVTPSIHMYCDTHRRAVSIYVWMRELFLLSSEEWKSTSLIIEGYHSLGLIRLLFFLGNPEKEKGRNMKLEIKIDNLRDVYFNYPDV